MNAELDRGSGVALWRQIADRIRSEFSHLADGERLPPEMELAMRFGVNRHTVRAAIAALVQEGALKSEQGRGTFIVRPRRLRYPITRRTRFSAGLEGQARERRSRLISHVATEAGGELAALLGVEASSQIWRIESVGEADGAAVSRATSFYAAERFPDFPAVYERTGSVTAAFAEFGISDYVRLWTRIEARHADPADIGDLRLAPGSAVLVTRALNADTQGSPIHYSVTRFAADRVELFIEHG